MPVHNGARTLRRALDSLLTQTYADVEIILSDNGSTDDTATIAREIAERDPRLRYFRQPQTLPAWANFGFVLEQAKGTYFFWAADDDVRAPTYVEEVVAALSGQPGAVLAVTDVVRFHPDVEPASGTISPAMARPARSQADLIRQVILSDCSEFYGLYRLQYLRDFPWMSFDYGPDHILLLYIRLRGEVVRVPRALFYESIRRAPKRRRQRVKEGFYGNMRRFRMLRFAWQMGEVARVAGRQSNVRVVPAFVVVYAYCVIRVSLTKVYLYEHAPPGVLRLWRQMKPRTASPAS
jgi:glycosyltransferase involved in cell wall biosynthesis